MLRKHSLVNGVLENEERASFVVFTLAIGWNVYDFQKVTVCNWLHILGILQFSYFYHLLGIWWERTCVAVKAIEGITSICTGYQNCFLFLLMLHMIFSFL